jgi:DNA mismatch repair protein MutS
MAMTPMMVQYLEIKEKYKDCIILFRLGDFYEMFFDDAIVCSRELELTLTGKDCGLEERAPMCGIPSVSISVYIPKLVEKGYKIAICEQVEDPKKAVGIVKRDVVRIVTPGTITELDILDDKKNNYIASFEIQKNKAAFAYSDISTGEVFYSTIILDKKEDRIIDEISRVLPSEIVISKDYEILKEIKKRFGTYISFYENDSKNNLLNNMEIDEIQFKSLNTLLNYVSDTQKGSISQINSILEYDLERHMQLDIQTRKNLEISESNSRKSKKGSLLDILDNTVTSMGARLFRRWVESPLIDKNEILKRQFAVEKLNTCYIVKDEIVELLKKIYDIERLASKVVAGTILPKELISMKNSIVNLPNLREKLKILIDNEYINDIFNKFDELQDIYNLINESIQEDPPITIKEGNIIKKGYDSLIDEYKLVSIEGKNWLMELEYKEKELTGIKNLKVNYNKIFGYYLEVTNSYKSLVPKDRYITKQTLAGCERYITEELKNIEVKILNAEEKLNDLEYEAYTKVRELIGKNITRIQRTAHLIAIIDSLISMSNISLKNNYIRPIFNDENIIEIKEGRHPVVEDMLKDISFIPNDTYLNDNDDMFNIITGPNMAGKSTYMRQVALICYMAQIGSFVPANFANLCVLDKIFTRVGASDDLAMGQSTFMVEMIELSNILKNATNKSLVILDEIGRGTSTYDGLAIAWATVEHIVNINKCKTLFATHYHELTELQDKTKNVKNYSVQVQEENGDVIFLHKILPGSADESYGIYVAKLAGVPKTTIDRAKEILKELELSDIAKKSIKSSKKINAEEIAVDMFNYKLNEVSKLIEKTDLDELTPKEGLEMLYKIKEKLK